MIWILFIRVDGGEHSFQTVIAMPPERRVGDDYLPTPDDSVKLRPYEPERGHIEGPSWVATAVAAKSAKSFASVEKPNLLVYANFSASKLTADMLRGAMPTDDRTFGSIWIVTN